MWISGTGIDGHTECRIMRNFDVRTKLALEWTQASDGNWYATDRGSTVDVYQTRVRLRDYRWDIDAVLDAIESNRTAQSNQLTLSNFAADEHVFGEDVNHSGSINAVITNYGEVKQQKLRSFQVVLELQAVGQSFTGSTTMPNLHYVPLGYTADSEVTVEKYDTYTGGFYQYDMGADAGVFEGDFFFNQTDAQSMRGFIRATRGDSFTINASDVHGIPRLFGTRRGTYPYTVKILEWTDNGTAGLTNRILTLKLAEVV